jgi:hypothetical protein
LANGLDVSVRLIEDPDGVAALASRVAAQIGIPVDHVEKDFWVTEVLRGVVDAASALRVPVIFKGGTSLSKAYSILQRFSEDVDVLVLLPVDDTKGSRDRILKALVEGARRSTLRDPISVANATTTGAKRGAKFYYREARQLGDGLSEGVFLELGSRGGVLPSERRSILSLIGQHAGDWILAMPEATPVEVLVMDPLRTLVEKLVLLHTTHSGEDEREASRNARHYYDVHQLLVHDDIAQRLDAESVALIASDVVSYSTLADRPVRSRPKGGFAQSPAFAGGRLLGVAREAYERQVLEQLLWPMASRPSFKSCLEIVAAYADVI